MNMPAIFQHPASAILQVIDKLFEGQDKNNQSRRFILDIGAGAEPVSTQIKRLQQEPKNNFMTIMSGAGISANIDITGDPKSEEGGSTGEDAIDG